ncbi:MAG: hypothetical protein AAFR11_02100 [Pseudomonadota bacterium]
MRQPRIDADGMFALLAAAGRALLSVAAALGEAAFDWSGLKLLAQVAMFGGGCLLLAVWRPLPSAIGAALVAASAVWIWTDIARRLNRRGK